MLFSDFLPPAFIAFIRFTLDIGISNGISSTLIANAAFLDPLKSGVTLKNVAH